MSLEPCPSSPNCVCTQGDESDAQHYMAPMEFSGSASDVLDVVARVVSASSGATVASQTDTRIDAVFVSRFFRFKDDVSFLVDASEQKLHFRSASRVGHSDLGANRKRMDALVAQIKASL